MCSTQTETSSNHRKWVAELGITGRTRFGKTEKGKKKKKKPGDVAGDNATGVIWWIPARSQGRSCSGVEGMTGAHTVFSLQDTTAGTGTGIDYCNDNDAGD